LGIIEVGVKRVRRKEGGELTILAKKKTLEYIT